MKYIAEFSEIDFDQLLDQQGNLNHFELKHPLCSGDSRDFCLHPGDRVGFRLEYLDFVDEGIITGSYLYPGIEDTSLADIVVAECPALYLPLIKKCFRSVVSQTVSYGFPRRGFHKGPGQFQFLYLPRADRDPHD
jgi:hypothetical protein